MTEPEVTRKVYRFLRSGALWDHDVIRLFSDAHPSLLSHKDLRPFQRFTLDVGDFVVHPDLVGQLDDGETVFAIEAKGTGDLLKGLTQAELYQIGFHYSFLAADAGSLGDTLLRVARQKNVGVLAVGDDVKVAHLSEARRPWREAFRSIARQMETVVQVTEQQTFQYNLPTHYLAWSVLLQPGRWYTDDALQTSLRPYPMPKGWRAALAGAQKLGIVHRQGDRTRLTDVGAAVRDIVGATPSEWGEVHREVSSRARSAPTLAERHPAAAAALRLLLLHDPLVRLVVSGLRTFDDGEANFQQLAMACDRLDHDKAPIFFLNPETIEDVTDERGHVLWDEVAPQHYRSRMFYQYKRILQHAGILEKAQLGGASTRGYDPHGDQ